MTIGCHNYTDNSSAEKYPQLILGDWNQTYSEKEQVITKGDIFMRNPYELFRYTLSTNDSLEYHLGFFKGYSEYCGNFAAYRIIVQATIYYDDTVKNVAVYDGYYPAGLAHALIPLHILYVTIPLTKVDSLEAEQWSFINFR